MRHSPLCGHRDLVISQALKECSDEIDLGTQYHLTRYAFLFESIVLSDGTILVPPQEEGMAHFFYVIEFVNVVLQS